MPTLSELVLRLTFQRLIAKLMLTYVNGNFVSVNTDPGKGVFISDPKKPVGGHVLAHAATITLRFMKGKGEKCVSKVFDAPNLPGEETVIYKVYFKTKKKYAQVQCCCDFLYSYYYENKHYVY